MTAHTTSRPADGPSAAGETLAEAVGLTAELADAIAGVAQGELEAGRVEAARTILEGLVVSNPRDARAWVLLARVHLGLRHRLAARFCAEVASSLEPDDPTVRLMRAEGLLLFEAERGDGARLLRGLEEEDGRTGDRARALLAAMEG